MTAPSPDDVIYDIHDPAMVERKIQETKNRIAKGVGIVTRCEQAAKKARRDFDNAFAHAFIAAPGPPSAERMRRSVATAETIREREAAEEAEVAFKHAERQADALSKELFAWQSILNSVRTMFQAAGAR